MRDLKPAGPRDLEFDTILGLSVLVSCLPHAVRWLLTVFVCVFFVLFLFYAYKNVKKMYILVEMVFLTRAYGSNPK